MRYHHRCLNVCIKYSVHCVLYAFWFGRNLKNRVVCCVHCLNSCRLNFCLLPTSIMTRATWPMWLCHHSMSGITLSMTVASAQAFGIYTGLNKYGRKRAHCSFKSSFFGFFHTRFRPHQFFCSVLKKQMWHCLKIKHSFSCLLFKIAVNLPAVDADLCTLILLCFCFIQRKMFKHVSVRDDIVQRSAVI